MNQNIKKYPEYHVEDFVHDPFFRDWVLGNDPLQHRFWSDWCENHPEKEKEIEEARKILNEMKLPDFQLPLEEIVSLWDKIKRQSQPDLYPNKKASSKWKYLPYAAVLVMILSVSFLFWQSSASLISYQTGFGETKEILLPDSSVIILNANSKIYFYEDWENQSSRQITLEGEAFFSINHLADHQPFKVLTSKGIAVEVLGTEFNVYHRAEETKVLLSSGLVSLSFPMSKKEGKILMKPGDLVEFKESKYQRKMVDPETYASWTNNILNLDQTTLKEMVRMGRENYGIEVVVEDSVSLDHTASGSMPIGDARSFMNQTAKIFNVEIAYQNNKYIIK